MLQRVRARNSGLDRSSFSSSGIGSSERRQWRCDDCFQNDEFKSALGKAHHFVHDIDRFTEAVCLETYAFVRSEQRVESYGFIEIGAVNRYGLV